MTTGDGFTFVLFLDPAVRPSLSVMTKGREEQIKLRATDLNSLAVAIAAIGGFAPLVAVVLRPDEGAARTLLLALICLAMSYVLHAVGRRMLKDLDR